VNEGSRFVSCIFNGHVMIAQQVGRDSAVTSECPADRLFMCLTKGNTGYAYWRMAVGWISGRMGI